MSKRTAFVSYHRRTSGLLARLVAAKLEEAGIPAFLDVDDRPAAGPFPAHLRSEIASRDVVVVLLAEGTLDSRWVLDEIEYAHTAGKVLIPILQEDFARPDDDLLTGAARELLECNGVRVFDRSNQYVREALQHIVDLVQTSTVEEGEVGHSSGVVLGVERYRELLIAELNNNLVLELYDRRNYEDICVTPLVSDPLARTFKPVPLDELIGRHRLAVVGEPGSGKTTALRKLCLDLLRAEDNRTLPVYISLASFDMEAAGVRSDFQAFLDEEVRLLGAKSLGELTLGGTRSLLLALDGWDEVHDQRAKSAIRRYLSGTTHAVVITSRPEAQSTLPVSDRVSMLKLDFTRIQQFLRLRLKSDVMVDRLMHWLEERPDLRQLAENPLSLSLLTIVFEEEGEDLRRMKRTRLFERAFETIVAQHHRLYKSDSIGSDASRLSRFQLTVVLEAIAYKMSVAGRRFFTVREFDQVASQVLDSSPDGLAEAAAGRLGVIRDRRSGRLEFFHLWYQEFLAARRLVETRAEEADTLSRALDDPRLAALLPFAVGLLADQEVANQLLREVEIPDIFNFCRAIGEGDWTTPDLRAHIRRVISFAESLTPKAPVRVELAPAIAQVGEQAIEVLVAIASDPCENDYARRTAIEALAILPTERAAYEDLLVELLRTDQLGLLWHVVEQVGRMKVLSARPILQALLDHPDPIVVGDAFWALGQMAAPEAGRPDERLIEDVIACLGSEDAHRQGHALRTLGRLKSPSAFPYLLNHLKSASSGYRWIVPEAAALINGPGAVEIIDAALSDDDLRVVAAGLVACPELTEPMSEELTHKVRPLLSRRDWVNSIQQTLGNAAQRALNAENARRPAGPPARLLLARHCETLWSSEGRLQGSVDTSLSALGVEHARTLAQQIQSESVTHVFSSPQLRALQTAQAYADVFGLPVTRLPGFRELDHGEWEGRLLSELDVDPAFRGWLQDPANHVIPGSVESAAAAQQRAVESLRTVVSVSRGGVALIVAHKHVLALLACALENLPLSSFPALVRDSATPLEVEPDRIARLIPGFDPS